MNRRFPCLHRRTLLIVVLSVVVGGLVSAWTIAAQQSTPARTAMVRLVIDYNDGTEKHYTRFRWKAGMTVFDTMNEAAGHPRKLQFKSTGSGANVFISEIDGMTNEGGGKDKKNWIFMVNDKLANKSCGVFELEAGDVVVWRFGRYMPE